MQKKTRVPIRQCSIFCNVLHSVHGTKKKIHSLFSLLIPTLYKTCSESNTIFVPLCSTLLRPFRKDSPPPFGSEALQSRGLWFSSHFIRLTRGSLCDLPLLRSLPLSLTTVVLRIVICWFPWQPTRTCVQGELTDIEWKNMKQWLLAQMLVPFIRLLHTLPISLSDIKNLLLKVILRYNQTFFFLNSVLPELPSIIFSLPLTFWERLQFSRRKRALICFSLHQGSPINVKREIRGLHEVNKKNKSQWASTKRGHCYQSSN